MDNKSLSIKHLRQLASAFLMIHGKMRGKNHITGTIHLNETLIGRNEGNNYVALTYVCAYAFE